MEWKAGLDLARRWLPASLRAPLRGPDPGGRGLPRKRRSQAGQAVAGGLEGSESRHGGDRCQLLY